MLLPKHNYNKVHDTTKRNIKHLFVYRKFHIIASNFYETPEVALL